MKKQARNMGRKAGNAIAHTALGWKMDDSRRSAEGWERGRKAKKIGNPSYKPVKTKKGKRYRLRVG